MPFLSFRADLFTQKEVQTPATRPEGTAKPLKEYEQAPPQMGRFNELFLSFKIGAFSFETNYVYAQNI